MANNDAKKPLNFEDILKTLVMYRKPKPKK